jgi:hypothetical protein
VIAKKKKLLVVTVLDDSTETGVVDEAIMSRTDRIL